MQYEIKNIAGIDCIFAPMQDSSSITIEILLKAWSIYETKETNGLSHFLEHMFFKWWKKYPTKKDVSTALDIIGADYNAFTGSESAGYYVKSAPEFRQTGIDVLADMLLEATFEKDEIEKERGVIVEEIKRKNDIPEAKLYVDWSRNYYGDNSYWRSILGPEENILSFTQEQLFQHKNDLYTKDNMVIVITGQILEQDELESTVEKFFWKLPEKAKKYDIMYTNTHPLGKQDIIQKGIEQANIFFGAPGAKDTDMIRYQYSLLANILGGTSSSRLYEEIRENRWLAYGIYAWHYPESDHGYFYISAWLTKERYQEWTNAIQEILVDIAKWNIQEGEFSKAQNNIIGSLQMGLETSNEVATFLGNQYLFKRKIETIEEKINIYKNLSLEEIKNVAPIVHPDNFYGCIML